MGYDSNLQQFMAFIYCLNLLQLRIFYQSLMLCESLISDCSIPRMLTQQFQGQSGEHPEISMKSFLKQQKKQPNKKPG